MAAPVVNSEVVLCDVPFRIHKLNVTSGATATAVSHTGPATPDLVLGTQISENPTGGDFACTAKAASTVTLDFEDDGNDTWEIFLFFFNTASGGIS